MSKELEDIGKQFIMDEDAEHEDIKELISRALNFCKIDKRGYVRLEKTVQKATVKDKIMLILIARHLASMLQEKLGHESTIDRKSTRLNSSHTDISRMPSSA